MTLVFCHYIEDKLIIVTDSLITGHNARKQKCAAFSAKPIVITWWGDQNLEPKVLTDNPLTVQPGDKAFAASSSIVDKLPIPEDVWPCFPSAFMKALNENEHVHNGNRGKGGLLMGVAINKRIHAFVYESTAGKSSWRLTDSSGVHVWPQVFGDTDSLNTMLQTQNPREDLSVLAGIKTSDEFEKTARRWIRQTEQFQKDHPLVVTVGLPAYKLVLKNDGIIEGPEMV